MAQLMVYYAGLITNNLKLETYLQHTNSLAHLQNCKK